MRRTEAHQGVRMIKFSSILSRYEAAEFSQAEAAELLGIGERTFRRWRQRFEDEGEAGLLDRGWVRPRASGFLRIERRGGGAVSHALRGFHGQAFHEHLVKEHNFSWAIRGRRPSFTRRVCWRKRSVAGLIAQARAASASWHDADQDGSMHVWLRPAGARSDCDLDDATSAIIRRF